MTSRSGHNSLSALGAFLPKFHRLPFYHSEYSCHNSLSALGAFLPHLVDAEVKRTSEGHNSLSALGAFLPTETNDNAKDTCPASQ